MELRRALRIVLALAALFALVPGAAANAQAPELREPKSQTRPPAGYDLTAAQVMRLAARAPKVRAERAEHDRFEPTAYTRGPGRWQVSYFGPRENDEDAELAQVRIDDATGAVLEEWVGTQVAWSMARGYEGAFGRKFNAPWIWIPLGLLFLAPFVDPRRPFRLRHLDLLALLAFGISHVVFNRGEVGTSVPLVYPVLGYLFARMAWIGFSGRREDGPLIPVIPVGWLWTALAFLVVFRTGMNLVDSNVIDVGYAGVIGADRIADGDGLYGGGFSADVPRGDTYGPLNYLSYLPFEQLLPWGGSWDGLPAAHAAAIAFDLATLVALFFLGRRLRGADLGVGLAYAWAAYPYAFFVLSCNANDSLVALLCVLALLAALSAPARSGFAIACAAAAKFAPLALAPVLATGLGGERRWRRAAAFGLALVAGLAVLVAPFLIADGPREVFDRTIGYQAGRASPFSLWGRYDLPGAVETAVRVATVCFGVLIALVPRRRTPVQLAALAAAVLIAVQITATYWFYLYVVWFAPLVFVALLAPLRSAEPARARA